MSTTKEAEKSTDDRLVEEIIGLQREFYLENRNKDTERRRRLREIIERATPKTSRANAS